MYNGLVKFINKIFINTRYIIYERIYENEKNIPISK